MFSRRGDWLNARASGCRIHSLSHTPPKAVSFEHHCGPGPLKGFGPGRLPPGAPAGMGVPAPPWGGPLVKAALGVPSRGLGWRCDKVRIRSGFGFSCFWGSPGAPWHANRGTCVFLIQALEFGAPARRCNLTCVCFFSDAQKKTEAPQFKF